MQPMRVSDPIVLPFTPSSVATYPPSHALAAHIWQAIAQADGWLPFDRFMHLALYAPNLGYYARKRNPLGHWPDDGSDFVTAPELSPLFGQTLAVQVQDALLHTGTAEVWEFGAGSGALAEQLLDALTTPNAASSLQRYTIVEVSSNLRQQQQQRLARFAHLVQWADALPPRLQGIVIGNEVLDAMPVQLLHRTGGVWHERGVAVHDVPDTSGTRFFFVWQDRPTHLIPPVDIEGGHDYLTEIHLHAQAFIRTVAERLQKGAAFFIDYGFGEREYYHPQRHMGTLMCHQGHRADPDPLHALGEKDITSHIDFTAMAVAAKEAGAHLLGYTSQGRFLINCGLAERMATASLPARAQAQKLMLEHEMGELFKVLAFCTSPPWPACGFCEGNRLHAL